MSLLWASWQEDWLLYHNVTFDGLNKRINVNPGVTDIDVKNDIYSSWKEWALLRDNAKFLPALRTIGGDALGGGQSAGDMYFLMNNWQIVVSENVKFFGIIYNDQVGQEPFIINPGGGVTSTVSSLAIGYNSGSGVGTVEQVADAVWNALASNYPTIGTTGSKLTSAGNAGDPWTTDLSTYTTPGSAGYVVKNTGTSVIALPTASQIASQVRTELNTELTRVMQIPTTSSGLTSTQATMILEMYELLGLDPTKPLIVTDSSRTAGAINQIIATSPSETIVTRV